MAKRSKLRSRPKQSSTKTNTKPRGFWQNLYQQIIKLRLHLALLAALGIFAIGMLLGVAFSIYYNDGSKVVARVVAQISPSEQYEGPVEVPKKVTQGTAALELDIPLVEAADGQSETIRNEQTTKYEPPQNTSKEEVSASMESQKDVPESTLIARKLSGNVVEAKIPPSEQYEGSVEAQKKVTQGTAALEPDVPSAETADGQSETIRNEQTTKYEPPQNTSKEEVSASMESQKDVPESTLIARKLSGNVVEAKIPPSEQYEGSVEAPKIVTQGTTFLEPDVPSAETAGEQSETVREKPTGTPKPAKNSYEYGALKSIKSKKNITGSKPSPTKASTAAWLRFAAVTPAQNGQPAIAIVMDDLGIDQRRTGVAIDLPAPITLAFIPYGYRLSTHTRRARENGHELLVHLPMEPLNANADPGKNALLKGLTDKQLRSRIEWNLTRFQGFVGINNHMGSKFTAWERGMKLVVETLKDRGLIFLDSKTTKNTVGLRLATALNVPNAARDVFLDNEISIKSIQRQLKLLERVARKNGSAIGICHPHDATVKVLRDWIPNAKKRGFILVPVSAIIKRKLLSG